jgi:hypothetical protein
VHKKRNLRRFSEQIPSSSPIPSNYCGCTWYLILYTARHPGSPCCAVLLAYSMSHRRRRLTPLTIAIRTDICIHSTSRPLPYLSAPQLLSWLHSQPGGHRTSRRHRVPHVGIPAPHPGLCRGGRLPSARDAFGRSRHRCSLRYPRTGDVLPFRGGAPTNASWWTDKRWLCWRRRCAQFGCDWQGMKRLLGL